VSLIGPTRKPLLIAGGIRCLRWTCRRSIGPNPPLAPAPDPVVGKAPIGKAPIGKAPIGKAPIGKAPIVTKG
jgi:hypothetical protein